MKNAALKARSGEKSLRTPLARRILSQLRFQFLLGLLWAVGLPTLLYHYEDPRLIYVSPISVTSTIGAAAAFLISLYLYRRVVTFPGVGLLGFVMPAVTAGYGIVIAVFFMLRLDYSRFAVALSFVAALIFLFGVSMARRGVSERFYVIPSRSTKSFRETDGAEWIVLKEARLPQDPEAVYVADLRADLGENWERLIAEAALLGHPVYHIKQVQESLTGRVEIEHLSENSFGSLVPNLSYRKLKRLLDLLTAAIALPVLAIPGLIVALLIKLDSPGPVFFRQGRRGFRGKEFMVLKFRTMTSDTRDHDGDMRNQSITLDSDPRITRLGRFLRRSRIDELPQIWNILRGDMSWIGPRPEALALSEWYMAELPFYTYRHIVRPGITGWAQVNQGHVADLGAVTEKLHYDFYYIKNFSAWLDLLIVLRTVGTVISGFGAK